MRFPRRLAFEHGPRQILFVPAVNILLLLVFFMLFASPLVDQPGVRLQMPGRARESAVAGRTLEIRVRSDGKAYYKNSAIREDELRALLSQAGPQVSVLIAGHPDVPLRTITRLWELCRASGIRRINVVTEGARP
jgi:biopolymer transport protein ExbD